MDTLAYEMTIFARDEGVACALLAKQRQCT